jgi:hypothetical protein
MALPIVTFLALPIFHYQFLKTFLKDLKLQPGASLRAI